MECNLGVGKVWSSTRNPVDQIMGAKTNGRQVHFAVELRLILFINSFYQNKYQYPGCGLIIVLEYKKEEEEE